MTINCPHCESEIEIDDSYSKTFMQDCLNCGQEFKVQIGDNSDSEIEDLVIEEPDPPKPIQKAAIPIIPEGWVCLKCEMVGKPDKRGGGGKFLMMGWCVILPASMIIGNAVGEESFLYGFFAIISLMAFFGAPIMGLTVGFKSETTHCFNCGHSDIIP